MRNFTDIFRRFGIIPNATDRHTDGPMDLLCGSIVVCSFRISMRDKITCWKGFVKVSFETSVMKKERSDE